MCLKWRDTVNYEEQKSSYTRGACHEVSRYVMSRHEGLFTDLRNLIYLFLDIFHTLFNEITMIRILNFAILRSMKNLVSRLHCLSIVYLIRRFYFQLIKGLMISTRVVLLVFPSDLLISDDPDFDMIFI